MLCRNQSHCINQHNLFFILWHTQDVLENHRIFFENVIFRFFLMETQYSSQIFNSQYQILGVKFP